MENIIKAIFFFIIFIVLFTLNTLMIQYHTKWDIISYLFISNFIILDIWAFLALTKIVHKLFRSGHKKENKE